MGSLADIFLRTAIFPLILFKHGVPRFIGNTERLTRFLFKGDIAVKTNELKPQRLRPYPHRDLSVYRLLKDFERRIWDIGDQYVAKILGKKITGRAEFIASAFFERGLQPIPYPMPHVLHAIVDNWPPEKEEQMQVAQELSSLATVISRAS